jgi:flagellar export protein FliJ
MRKALATLLRVRHIEKKVAESAFVESEQVRQTQEGRVHGVYDAMEQSREAEQIGLAAGEAHWLAASHSHRLRLEVDLRRESGILQERARVVAQRRAELVEADRNARVVELALEQYDARVELEEKRREGRLLDEMATVRWWREQDQ